MKKLIVGGVEISKLEDRQKKLIRKINEIIKNLGLSIELLSEK